MVSGLGTSCDQWSGAETAYVSAKLFYSLGCYYRVSEQQVGYVAVVQVGYNTWCQQLIFIGLASPQPIHIHLKRA